MTTQDRTLLLVVSDAALTERLVAELGRRSPAGESSGRPRGHFQLPIANTLAQARARLMPAGSSRRGARRDTAPAAILLDDSVLGSPSQDDEESPSPDPSLPTPTSNLEAPGAASRFPESGLQNIVAEFAAFAPVVLLIGPRRLGELAILRDPLVLGKVDCVLRYGDFLPLALALLERHGALRGARRPSPAPAVGSSAENFGEVLRHKVNNPLTGILGNAELLLARREQLSPRAAQRLETIVELAVHLRETVRQLSDQWEAAVERSSSRTLEPRRF